MQRFEVWAPTPERVELVLADERVAMERDERGWWSVEVDSAGPGTRYGFALDGGPALPDPRSMHQPAGIHGLSAVVDHSTFAWSDSGWRGRPLAGSVLYELHVGTFSPAGTFDGVSERLAHLVDLGVDAVELMPVAEFPGDRGWGYDGVDLYAPHHAYGGPDGLKRLVDACHAAGLAVVMDVVYNHLGPAGNHLPAFGPYFTDRHRTPWGDAVSFDGPGADEVRRFVVDNALMWLRDYHCDGLRLDAVHAIVDQSALHILEQLAIEVDDLADQLDRALFVIAENDTNDPRLVRPRDLGGYGLDAAWADDWHHALHVALTGESSGYYQDFTSTTPSADPSATGPPGTGGSFLLETEGSSRRFGEGGRGGPASDGSEPLVKALVQAWVHDGTWSESRQRTHGRSPAGLEPVRFVVCTQNHDQVGNRAQGERSAALTSEGRLHMAAALLLTSPFIPMLFQGEEWAASSPFQYFTDHHDPDLGRAVREGRRQEFAGFGWAPEDVPDPQDRATFERSRLRWADLDDPQHERMLDWYRRLMPLRRTEPAITDPTIPTSAELDDGLLVVRRGPVSVTANLSDAPRALDLPAPVEVLAASPGVGRPDTEGSVGAPSERPSVASPLPAGAESVMALVLPVDSVVVCRSAG